MRDFLNAPRDRRNEMFLGVENTLQQLLELGLVRLGLNLKDLRKDTPILEDFDRKVIEVDIKDAHTGMSQPGDQIFAILAQVQAIFGIECADEEGNLVAQPLLVQEPFAGNHPEQVLGTDAPIRSRSHNYPPFPGKIRKSAGLLSSISRFMCPDNQIG